MTKLEIKVIKESFPSIPFETLECIINATGNSEVAVEMLCGIFEEPVILEVSNKRDSTEFNPTFVSYNPFKKTVEYTYHSIPQRTVWVPKINPVINVPFEEIPEALYSYSDDKPAKFLGISTEELRKEHTQVRVFGEPSVKVSTNTCDLSRWQ
jgi:hypothetical protein